MTSFRYILPERMKLQLGKIRCTFMFRQQFSNTLRSLLPTFKGVLISQSTYSFQLPELVKSAPTKMYDRLDVIQKNGDG